MDQKKEDRAVRGDGDVKLSVIIPVYNAEKYLAECLDSILGQSLRELEVICVDDGSRDGSAAVLKDYAGRDSRVRVIEQENSGAGAARNRGLETAAGEYVLFMDADDTLEGGSLEKLWKEARRLRPDVLRCRALDYDNQSGAVTHGVHNYLKRVPPFLFHVPLRYSTAWPIFPRVSVAPWGGIVRRDFLLGGHIRFNGLICVNDRSFYWETVLKARRAVFTDTVLTRYRMNLSDSLIGARLRHFDCHFRSYELVEKLCAALPARQRRSILNGEMQDMANWLETGMKTELGPRLLTETAAFIEKTDKSPWHGHIENTAWYKRIRACEKRSI